MPSINDQVNKYQSAADGPRNRGSQPSKQQMSTAKNTAIGGMRGTINRRPVTAAVRSDTGMSVSRSSSHLRPSKEGLMQAPSAWIAGNQSGYANPAIQKARYKTKGINIPQSSAGFSMNHLPRNVITDYRNKGFSTNSVRKLGSIMKKRLL